MDISGIWKDPKTTIIGLAIIGVSAALALGSCTFADWKEFVLLAIGIISGGGLMLSGKTKEPKAPEQV